MAPTTHTASAATPSIKQAIASHPIAAFLIILYPVSWVLFLPAVLGKSGIGVLPVDIPAQVSILLVTIFGLTGATFLVTRLADGKSGTRELRRHYLQLRVAPQWYVLALFGAPLLLLVVALVTRGTGALNPFGAHASEIPTAYLLNLVVIAILISVWEEGAWTAFLTARLQRRFGPVLASVMVAPLFGLIHAPLFLVNGGLTDGRPQGLQVVEYAFYLLILFSVPMRILITWMFNATGGSVPVIALFHASIDATASSAILTTFYPGVDGRLLYVAMAVGALAVVLITRGRLGYREAPPTTARRATQEPVLSAARLPADL
jgi:CAAX protease family protein